MKTYIRLGMHVIINKDISRTHKLHLSCQDMIDMRGKEYRVEGIKNESTIIVEGFTWDAGDLTILYEEKKSQPFHFNIEELES